MQLRALITKYAASGMALSKNASFDRQSTLGLVVLAIASGIATFVVDVFVSTEFAIEFFYIALVVIGTGFSSRSCLFYFAIIASVLCALGAALSLSGEFSSAEAANRLVAICGIWIVTIVGFHTKEVRSALGKAIEQLNAILNNSTALIYLKDTQGKYMLVNKQFEQMTGMTNENLRGMTDHEIFVCRA